MTAWTRGRVIAATLLASGGSAVVLLRCALQELQFRKTIGSKPGGAPTPASVGLDYQEVWLTPPDRRLQAWYVPAPSARAALLIFQDGSEVIADLVPLVRYLHDHGLSCLVFDYSGNGHSTGRQSREVLREDGLAAYDKLRQLAGKETPVFLWGFASGAARLLDVVSHGMLAIKGIILAGAFTSLRDLAREQLGAPRWLTSLMMARTWDNCRTLRLAHVPVLLVHSRDDEQVPYAHAQELLAAGGPHTCLATVDGLKHGDCWSPVHDAYWTPVFEFVHAHSASQECDQPTP